MIREENRGRDNMEAIHIQRTLAKDGELVIKGIPYKKGQVVEVVLMPKSRETAKRPRLTVGRLKQSGLIGMWADREDIGDSAAYARQLRKQAQRRGESDSGFDG